MNVFWHSKYQVLKYLWVFTKRWDSLPLSSWISNFSSPIFNQCYIFVWYNFQHWSYSVLFRYDNFFRVMYIIIWKGFKKEYFVCFLFIPFQLIIFLLLGEYYTAWTTLFLHIIAYLYCVYFFKRFFEYTKNNNRFNNFAVVCASVYKSIYYNLFRGRICHWCCCYDFQCIYK